jgi:hypothetical protein
MTAGAAFTPRSSSGRWCLFLFLCHTFHPFNRRPGLAGTAGDPGQAGATFLNAKNFLGARN